MACCGFKPNWRDSMFEHFRRCHVIRAFEWIQHFKIYSTDNTTYHHKDRHDTCDLRSLYILKWNYCTLHTDTSVLFCVAVMHYTCIPCRQIIINSNFKCNTIPSRMGRKTLTWKVIIYHKIYATIIIME